MKKAIFISVCFYGTILVGMLMVLNQSFFVDICVEYGISSEFWTGIFTAFFFGGQVLINIFGGELCERFGKKTMLIIGSAMAAVGCLLLGICSNVIPACAAFLLAGCGHGLLEGQLYSVLADESGTTSNRIANFNATFFSVGAIVAPLVASLFKSIDRGWHIMYYILAGMFVLFCIFFSFQHVTRRAPAPKKKEVVSFQLLKRPAFIIAGIMIFLYLGAESGATAWTDAYFQGTAVNSSLALAIFWAATGVARFVAGLIGSEERKHGIIRICAILAVVGLMGMLFIENPVLRVISFALSGLGFGPLWSSFLALGLDVSGKYTGAGSGIMICLFGHSVLQTLSINCNCRILFTGKTSSKRHKVTTYTRFSAQMNRKGDAPP